MPPFGVTWGGVPDTLLPYGLLCGIAAPLWDWSNSMLPPYRRYPIVAEAANEGSLVAYNWTDPLGLEPAATIPLAGSLGGTRWDSSVPQLTMRFNGERFIVEVEGMQLTSP